MTSGVFVKAGLVVCLSAVFSTAVLADDDVKDEFLKDMAAGLEARWEITDSADDTNVPVAEKMDLWSSYVDAELDLLEKYKEETFSNERFDLLAKTYIYGLELQKNAVQYCEDYPAIYESLWSAGYTTRAVALCDIYDYYGLDIEASRIDDMRSAAEPAYTYEEVTTDASSSDASSSEASSSDTSFQETETEAASNKIAIVSVEAADPGYDYIELKYKVKNISESKLSDLTLIVSELDENNDIIGTAYLVTQSTLNPGQSITLTGTTTDGSTPAALQAGSYFYSDEDVYYQEAHFEGSEDFVTCTLEDVLKDNHAEEVQSASDTDIEVFNNEGITVYLGGAEEISNGGLRMHIRIENLNHRDIAVSMDEHQSVINGSMVQTYSWTEVKSGKTASVNWDIFEDDLAEAGIEKMENISFRIKIVDPVSYFTIYTGDDVFLNVDDDYTLTSRTVYTDKEHIRQVQELLNKLGYECGSADGISGKKTNSCILAFEKEHGLAETTEITPELIAALEEAAE